MVKIMDQPILRENLISVLKAQQWAKIKGELDALVCLEGSKFSKYEGNKAIPGDWIKIQEACNEFIKKIEDEGLHE